MTARPNRVRLRAYQVGFGDCLLLTVTYGSKLNDGRTERHMLVDFGSREQRPGGPSMADIAAKIAEQCGARLDVVVATHRHQDHVKGFGDRSARQHLDALRPKLVVRPWTDVPESDSDDPALQLDGSSRQFVSLLEGIHREASYVDRHFALDEGSVARQAKRLAALGIKNAAAIAALDAWADGQGAWVRAGDDLDLESVMPGVRVQILGPPTLSEVPEMTGYAKASNEYWLTLAAAGELGPMIRPQHSAAFTDAFSTVAQPGGAGAAGWLLRELSDQEGLQALSVVEGFDDVLNNTSVILLVTVGRRTMLLAGDAQVENWSLTLDKALGDGGRPLDRSLQEQLAGVELYKVGHHGSRNATPKRLYRLWERRIGTRRPLVSVLTTLHGVYDNSAEGEVPKADLVRGLAKIGPVHSTEDLPEDVWWFDLEASTKGAARYVHSMGAPVS